MNRTEQARLVICRLDEQAERDSVVHRLSPLSKLLITIAYIAITTSYNKYGQKTGSYKTDSIGRITEYDKYGRKVRSYK